VHTKSIGVALATAVVAATLGLAGPVAAHTTGIHDNCTKLNQKWAHGVGRKGAVDRTSGTRVTSFYRNTDAYKAAMAHNGTLDRDKDGIACEKA
jgi:hypothetical protein